MPSSDISFITQLMYHCSASDVPFLYAMRYECNRLRPLCVENGDAKHVIEQIVT